MEIQRDAVFYIATGKCRQEAHWKNEEWSWGKFVERVSGTHRTAERLAEYMSATKTRQDEIKVRFCRRLSPGRKKKERECRLPAAADIGH